MKSRFTSDRKGAAASNSVRTLVATLCVLGLVGLTLFHFDDGGRFANRFATATAAVADGRVANPEFLRAPTSDPSLPSLEATFSRPDVMPANQAMAPTF